jgi:hypothetical protein
VLVLVHTNLCNREHAWLPRDLCSVLQPFSYVYSSSRLQPAGGHWSPTNNPAVGPQLTLSLCLSYSVLRGTRKSILKHPPPHRLLRFNCYQTMKQWLWGTFCLPKLPSFLTVNLNNSDKLSLCNPGLRRSLCSKQPALLFLFLAVTSLIVLLRSGEHCIPY